MTISVELNQREDVVVTRSVNFVCHLRFAGVGIALSFSTTEPLEDPDLFVHRCLQQAFPNKDVEDCLVVDYVPRRKSRSYLCRVICTIPSGVEFRPQDQLRLQTLCTPEGQVKPVLFRLSCCQDKRRLVDESISWNWSAQDGCDDYGRRPEEKVGYRLVQDKLEKLTESIGNVIGATCGRV